MAAPELTFDGSGNPYVEVFFDPAGLEPDTAYIQVWRYSEGREWQVRGGINIPPGVAALDFEAPPGMSIEYRAEMFTATGASLGWSETGSLSTPSFGVTIHNPLDPTSFVRVPVDAVLTSLLGTNDRPVPGGVVYVEGRSEGISVGVRRRGVVGLRFGIALTSLEDVDRIQGMVGGYGDAQLPVLCVRTPSTIRMPSTAFLRVSDFLEDDLNTSWGGSDIHVLFTGTEVQPPFPGLAVPLLTYDDLDAAYVSYDERDAAYASYTDMDRDYSLAGLAG